MSDDTSTVRILDADPERVVSVTVGELQELLRDEYPPTIHERTCHPISSHEALPDMDWEWFSEELTKNHAFGLLRFCSVCHSPLGQSDTLESFCSRCGSRVMGE